MRRPPSWICNTVLSDHPRSHVGDLKTCRQFCVNRLTSFRDMRIFHFRHLCLKMSIPFREAFGVWPHMLTDIVETLKRHIVDRKHAFWCIDRLDRSRNATWTRDKESKKERKKRREETQKCNKSLCAQTTHVALTHQSCHVLWRPDVVNHAKFRQNWFRGFCFLRGRNPPFSYVYRYGLCNRLGLPPNL